MNNELKIKKLQLEIELLKAKIPVKAKVNPVAKCKAWVKSERKGDFIKAIAGTHVKKDGTKIPIQILSFSNKESYNLSEQGRFWKVK